MSENFQDLRFSVNGFLSSEEGAAACMALVSEQMCPGIRDTWRSLSLLAGPAALLKQVPNGFKIRFGQFFITTPIHALVTPLPFILQPVSLYLSNWCYWWRGTDLPPFTPLSGLPPPPPDISLAIRPHVSSSTQAHYFHAPLHIELYLTPGRDEPLTDQTWLTSSLEWATTVAFRANISYNRIKTRRPILTARQITGQDRHNMLLN